MGSNLKPFIFSLIFSSCFLCRLTLTSSETTLPKNVETRFPSLPSPAFLNLSPPPPPLPPSSSSVPPPTDDSKVKVTKAVIATATSSFAFCGLLFFIFQLLATTRRRQEEAVQPKKSFHSQRLPSEASHGLRRSVFVDENGLDAVYWREFNEKICHHCNKEFDASDPREEDEEEEEEDGKYENVVSPLPRNDGRIQEKPMLPASFIKSSSSQEDYRERSSSSRRPRQNQNDQHLSPPPPTRRLPPLPGRAITSAWSRQPMPEAMSSASPSPLPQSPPEASSTRLPPRTPAPPISPPPPPPPAPPPRPSKKTPAAAAAPPPLPPVGSRVRRGSGGSSTGMSPAAAQVEGGPKKLKPLHWDKVNPVNVEHSMVWDKITNGSFRVDEDTMEVLFGTTVATNRNKAANNIASSSSEAAAATTSQICLLDPRKSHNIAIVLRSMTLSRQDILDGVLEGCGLGTDTLERLCKIAPTEEEEGLIRGYTGDTSKLADAESFLFHILGAVPAPFARLHAMLFKSTYHPEVAHLKQSLHTLAEACRELKTPTRGLFLKLLEAVLKAGNRMNAGTARGNAQAFNLTALRKLADVKSTDGSTTLLHFVVQEVVRSEGKRLQVVNRNLSLRPSDSGATLDRATSRSAGRGEREKEYIMHGLPVVGGLSDEFANLRKAVGIDYEALTTSCPALQARVGEIRRLLETWGDDGFTREMKAFVEEAEKELKMTTEEQVRVLELVKNTTEYYHAGASNDRGAHPLQLFEIVKDFLDMVGKACVDIARNLQKTKPPAARPSEEGEERGRRPVARFPNLPQHFLSDTSKSDSSSDED